MFRPAWQIRDACRPRCAEEVMAILLRNRGVDESFLDGDLKDLQGGLDMRGMRQGAHLMANHLAVGSKVVLVGDYDGDGVAALAQMEYFLRDIGFRNHVSIVPKRSEGYGIPRRALERHPDAALLVAMDCGTSDAKTIAEAKRHGMDCIVIDHHEVPEQGEALADVLINPKHPQCVSTFKEFCAAGLTLLFLAALRRCLPSKFPTPALGGKYLALAAIGTVTDMVPLVDGNRILVRHGLSAINNGKIVPINHLIREAGLRQEGLTAGHIAYYLGPRINAAGRVADARTALELLTSDTPDEAANLAAELNRLNSVRQREEDAVLREVRRLYSARSSGSRTVVMGDPAWSPGVVGIVATRVVREIHHGPTVVLSLDEAEGVARGSARSIPGFDLHGALKCCNDLLVKWGGHRMAGGLTVSLDCLEAFAKRFEEIAGSYPSQVFMPKAGVDMELPLDLATEDLFKRLKQLEPFGVGNPTPTFGLRGTRVSVSRVFGRRGDHLRLVLGKGTDAIYWRGLSHLNDGSWSDGDVVDVVFQMDWESRRQKPTLIIQDLGRLFGPSCGQTAANRR